MTDVIPSHRLPNVIDPATSTVCVDLVCRKCDYNLRTLPEQGRCPECGSPVALSTRGNFLQYANPEWVAKVAKGLQIVFIMIIVNIVVNLGVGCIGGPSTIIPILIAAGITVVDIIGVWMMTEPDPSGIGEEKNVSSRKIVRVSSVIAASAVGVQLVSILGGEFFIPAIGIVVMIVSVAAGIAQLVAYIAKYSYFAIIARRIPNQKLADQSLTIRKGTIVCFIVGVGAGILAAIFDGAGVGLFAIVLVPIGIGMLVFGILTIILIYRLQTAVTHESKAAQINWSTASQDAAPVASVPPTQRPPASGS